ncbi:unnamed protein product, partial [Protopolystoma xenopodis]
MNVFFACLFPRRPPREYVRGRLQWGLCKKMASTSELQCSFASLQAWPAPKLTGLALTDSQLRRFDVTGVLEKQRPRIQRIAGFGA